MGWVRIDDSFYDHDKFTKVGPLGIACWTVGLAYANRNLTNGFIPTRQARRLIDCEGIGKYEGAMGGRDAEAMDGVAELVAAGLWDEVPGGYRIHDYLDYQPSADAVRAQREKNAIRQQKWRETKNKKGHGVSDDVRNAVTDSVSDAVSDGLVTGAPNPNPSTSKESSGDRHETLRASDDTKRACTQHPDGDAGTACGGCRAANEWNTRLEARARAAAAKRASDAVLEEIAQAKAAAVPMPPYLRSVAASRPVGGVR